MGKGMVCNGMPLGSHPLYKLAVLVVIKSTGYGAGVAHGVAAQNSYECVSTGGISNVVDIDVSVLPELCRTDLDGSLSLGAAPVELAGICLGVIILRRIAYGFRRLCYNKRA